MSSSFSTDLHEALRVSWPMVLGFVPFGMTFGVLLVSSGLDWWWAPLWSAVIFAGSMEFLTIGLVLSGAPLATSALSAVAVNLRHIFYGISFPLFKIRSHLGKAYSVHTLTDEAYALLSPYRSKPATGTFLLICQAIGHAAWVSGSTVGAIVGAAAGLEIPGLEFVLTAFFTMLAIDAYRAFPSRLNLSIALGCGVLARIVLGDGMLTPALVALVVVLILARPLLQRHHPSGPQVLSRSPQEDLT